MRPAIWIARSSTPPNKNATLMAKVLLSIPELRPRALAEIRQQPGCHNVQDIAINRVTGGRAANNWSLCVLSAGAADAHTGLAPHSTCKAFYAATMISRLIDPHGRT